MHKLMFLAVMIMTCSPVAYVASAQEQKNGAENVQSCISIARIKSAKIQDQSHILFEMRGGKNWLSVLPQACSALRKWRAISYETSLDKLCKQDIITVFQDDLILGTCGLGAFHEVQDQTAGEEEQN